MPLWCHRPSYGRDRALRGATGGAYSNQARSSPTGARNARIRAATVGGRALDGSEVWALVSNTAIFPIMTPRLKASAGRFYTLGHSGISGRTAHVTLHVPNDYRPI